MKLKSMNIRGDARECGVRVSLNILKFFCVLGLCVHGTYECMYQRVRQYSLCRDDPGEKWRPYSINTLALR